MVLQEASCFADVFIGHFQYLMTCTDHRFNLHFHIPKYVSADEDQLQSQKETVASGSIDG